MIIVDDGTGVLECYTKKVLMALGDIQLKVGDYVMIVGAPWHGGLFLKFLSLVTDPNRETQWSLEVLEFHRRFGSSGHQ